MNKTLLGVLLGCIMTSLAFVTFFIPQVRESNKQQGFNDGVISSRLEIAQKIRSEFGAVKELKADYEEIFSVKTTSVIAVESENVKTLKVYE